VRPGAGSGAASDRSGSNQHLPRGSPVPTVGNFHTVPFQLIAKRFNTFRGGFARRYQHRRLLRRDFTIISDDCWGGQIYSVFGLKCHSPFIGMGVTAHEYIDFLNHFFDEGALDVLGVSTRADGKYHLIQTRHALLHGMHYDSAEDFRHTYERRCKTILRDRVFIKIDFGKKKYTADDIARWNALKLPNSVALYPDLPRFRALNIHNGVALPDWKLDGAKQFHISCRRFDIFTWLNHGTIELTQAYRFRQILLMEPDLVRRCLAVLHIGRARYPWP
jgi:uncharacterized protein (DUF1919 family)